MTFDNSAVLEPLEPPANGVDPPPCIGRNRHGGDQPGGPVGVTCGLGMVDGQLRQPVGLAPGGRPDVQLGDQLGLAPVQLGPQQLAEQVVIAVPLAAAVQRNQQQVRPLQALKSSVRPPGVQDRVAQRPGHAVQHCRRA